MDFQHHLVSYRIFKPDQFCLSQVILFYGPELKSITIHGSDFMLTVKKIFRPQLKETSLTSRFTLPIDYHKLVHYAVKLGSAKFSFNFFMCTCIIKKY